MLRRVASQMRNVLGKRFIGEASHRNNRENVTENGKILCEFKNFIVLLEKKAFRVLQASILQKHFREFVLEFM